MNIHSVHGKMKRQEKGWNTGYRKSQERIEPSV